MIDFFSEWIHVFGWWQWWRSYEWRSQKSQSRKAKWYALQIFHIIIEFETSNSCWNNSIKLLIINNYPFYLNLFLCELSHLAVHKLLWLFFSQGKVISCFTSWKNCLLKSFKAKSNFGFLVTLIKMQVKQVHRSPDLTIEQPRIFKTSLILYNFRFWGTNQFRTSCH